MTWRSFGFENSLVVVADLEVEEVLWWEGAARRRVQPKAVKRRKRRLCACDEMCEKELCGTVATWAG